MGLQRNKTIGVRFVTTFNFDIRSLMVPHQGPDVRRIKGCALPVNSATRLHPFLVQIQEKTCSVSGFLYRQRPIRELNNQGQIK